MDVLSIFIAVGILSLLVFFKTARISIGLTGLGAVLGACVAIVTMSGTFVPWEPLGLRRRAVQSRSFSSPTTK
jgi:hypothetical protein